MAQPFINPNYFAQPGYQSYQNYYQQPYQQMVAQNRLNQLEQQYPQFAQPQMQQPQQQQAPGLSGKIVDSIEVVKATDVPMDGNMYYFPKADGTEIFVKRWLANGTTQILAFKPCFDDETGNPMQNGTESKETAKMSVTEAFENVASQIIESFGGRFDEINRRFDDIEKKLTKGGAGK